MTTGAAFVGVPTVVPDRAWTLPWLAAGTEVLLAQCATVDPAAPSGLPGWSNGHVAAHVARNAEALGRLVAWARTGVETPMYASAAQRAAEIERDAARPRNVHLADLRSTAADLTDALVSLPSAAWTAEVRTARGRLVPAVEIPWLRVKEVWLHALDLGAATAVIPDDVGAALFADAARGFATRTDVPGLCLEPTGGDPIVIGDGATTVAGPVMALLTWLVGRSDGGGLDGPTPLPTLPAWL